MLEHQPLSMTMASESAWAFFINTFMQQETLSQFLYEYKRNKPDLDQLTDAWLLTILNDLTKSIFIEHHWNFQTQPTWVGRSPMFALREAVLQSLAAVSMDAELRIHGKRDPKNWAPEEWKRAKLSAQALDIYVRKQFPRPQQ